MRRKSILLLSLLILLIIGGVAVKDLRPRESPLQEFAAVDRFLRQFPAASGWRLDRDGVHVVSSSEPTWLEKFGIRRSGNFTQHYYIYSNPHGEGFISVIVDYDSRGIIEVRVRSEPPDAGGLRPDLLEKFPLLQPVLKLNH